MDNEGFDDNNIALQTVKPPNEGHEENGFVKEAIIEQTKPDGTKVQIEMQMVDGTEPQQPATAPYAGMGKEDLMRFSNTPFWNTFRLISILVFWAIWLALIGTVVGLTIVAPRCGTAPTPHWWQKSSIYQIYVKSFFDSNADGTGDIKGIFQKLDYIKNLGVDAILLSSIYVTHSNRSSDPSDPRNAFMYDSGYEVIDHMDVDSELGTMTDFEELLQGAHNRSINVILDFIPNHTGTQHPWFTNSSLSSGYDNPYWNFYVWAKCENGTAVTPPNNWRSVYNQEAWTYDNTRGECYLHQFLETQPELNLRSGAVQDHLEKILRFWLEKGVDGFRVVATPYLFEDSDFRNETETCVSSSYDCLNHTYTKSQPEVYDQLARWRSIVDSYPGTRRVLLTDGDVEESEAVKYYGTHGNSGVHLPINYQLARVNGSTPGGKEMRNLVESWINLLPDGGLTLWTTGDQDRSRVPSNVGESLVNAMNLLKMTLPGSLLIYYGDEIGMQNTSSPAPSRDPAGLHGMSRDPFRTPMQWDNTTGTAGFTNASEPWLSVGENRHPWNVQSQSGQDDGIWKKLQELTKLRSTEKSLQFGAIHYGYDDPNIFSFTREHEGNNRIFVAINFGGNMTNEANLRTGSEISIPSSAEVVYVTSSNALSKKVGEKVDMGKVKLASGDGFIAKWPYTRPV